MEALFIPGVWVAARLGLDNDTLEYLIALWFINGLIYIFILRTIFVVIGRASGLYHPGHYRHWPRLPWRSLVLAGVEVRLWYERVFAMSKRSTGGFAGALHTLSLLYKPGHVLLGRAYGFGVGLLEPVGIKTSRHLFMYAMTGAGKTTMLISIIAIWRGSIFVIDPKAQITNALFEHDWRRWHVLDPYGISNAESASFNAFDCIKAAMERDGEKVAVLWAMRIAQALVITPPGSRSPFFTDTARSFLSGVILHVLSLHPAHEHNLPYVRDLIVNGYRVIDDEGTEVADSNEAQKLFIHMMLKNPAFDGAVSGAAAAMASASGETGGNVRATLQEQTKWLDIPPVRAILRETSLPLSELKTRSDVVFSLTAPVLSIREELSPLCRLLTNMSAYTFEAVKEKNGQCLCVIDELPSQGHNETLEVMLAVARSYGQILLGISQNIELMRKSYPKSWGMFSGEADAVFWMASNHSETAAHLSNILGKASRIQKDRYTRHKSYREVDVMDADQVKRFLSPDSGRMIVTRAGARPLKLMSEPYFKALPVWCYAADPDHRETFLRRFSRWLLGRKAPVQNNPTSSLDEAERETNTSPNPFEEQADFKNETSENIIPFPTQPTGEKQ